MVLSRRDFIVGSAALAAATGCTRTSAPRAATTTADAPATATGPAAEEPVARKNMKLLILGGTGFLGPHVVAVARERGHQVTLFNRGKTNPDLFAKDADIEILHGDRDGKLDALGGRKWDAVVDNSGYVPRIVKMSADLLGPNVDQYLFVSTISVYDDKELKPGADESGPLAKVADETSEDVPQFYGALKALSEKAAEASMPGRVTVIRPGLIVGPRDPTDRFTYWPVKIARGGEVLAPGDGKDGAQFIDVRDLAAFMVTTLERRLTKVYNAVGPAEPLLFDAFLNRTRDAADSKATFTWVPTDFLLAQKVAPWADLPLWVPKSEDGGAFSSISAARGIADGMTFRPLEDTVKATLEWWNGLPEERRAKRRGGLSDEREAEVLAAYKASSPK